MIRRNFLKTIIGGLSGLFLAKGERLLKAFGFTSGGIVSGLTPKDKCSYYILPDEYIVPRHLIDPDNKTVLFCSSDMGANETSDLLAIHTENEQVIYVKTSASDTLEWEFSYEAMPAQSDEENSIIVNYVEFE